MEPHPAQRPSIGRLHVLTDTHWQRVRSHAELARLAFRGGADVVQIREKDALALDACLLGEIASTPRQANQLLLINDYAHWAQSPDWDGAHVGHADMPPAQARQLMGPAKILGVTVHSLAELGTLRQLPIHFLDYIGVGPVFGTQSKDTGLPPLGLEGLAAICKQSPWPVIAIGGITAPTVAAVLAAGAHGIAALGEVVRAEDPEAATRLLKLAIQQAIG